LFTRALEFTASRMRFLETSFSERESLPFRNHGSRQMTLPRTRHVGKSWGLGENEFVSDLTALKIDKQGVWHASKAIRRLSTHLDLAFETLSKSTSR
jgi:hypothetical protein